MSPEMGLVTEFGGQMAAFAGHYQVMRAVEI